MPQSKLTKSARNFDELPDTARIKIATVLAVTSVSHATIYRWMALGKFPKPHKIGNSQNMWSVGEVRRALSAG
jgi:predicted DNA-binding transcriptional regulator AlpA